MAKLRVCVVGAGLSGLATVKQCLEEGMEVQCFETRGEMGGMWAYQPDATPNTPPELGDVQSSAYAGLMLNSCRDTSAFSDFPLDPARYPAYFSHRLQLRYMAEYARHFDLMRHVRLRTRVLECRPPPEGTEGNGGKWAVRIKALAPAAKVEHDADAPVQPEPEEESLEFDAVFACTGHLSTPYTPDFTGRDSFTGQWLHSHYYRTPGPFEGKRVAIIGIGSSAVDIACEIGPQAAECHVITRRGAWILPRFVMGKVAEAWDNRASQVLLPPSVSQWIQTAIINTLEGKHPPELRPEHSLLAQNATVRGDFLEKVRTGLITVQRATVEAITPTGLMLGVGDGAKGDDTATRQLDVDVIICATGYNQFDLPYLPAGILADPPILAANPTPAPPSAPYLYQLIMPPAHRSLFLIGYIELFGPVAPTLEAQTRWATAVLTGTIPYPNADEISKTIVKFRAHQAALFYPTPRHALTAHPVEYNDALLAPLGAKPGFWKIATTPGLGLGVSMDVWFGISSSAQWRLVGKGAKKELAKSSVRRIAKGENQLSALEREVVAVGGEAGPNGNHAAQEA